MQSTGSMEFSPKLQHNLSPKYKEIIWKYKRPKIIKSMWSKKNIARGITIPDFKLHYGSKVTKQQSTATKERILHNPQNYSHLILM